VKVSVTEIQIKQKNMRIISSIKMQKSHLREPYPASA